MESILADASRIAEHLRLLDGEDVGRVVMLLTGLFSEIEALQEEIAKPNGGTSILAAAQIGDQILRAYWSASKVEGGLSELARLSRELSLTIWIHQS